MVDLAGILSPLLHAVAEANLFPDSKTIVDMPLRASPIQIATAFQSLALPDPSTTTPSAHTAAIKSFVNEWFDPVESDLISPFTPTSPLPPPPSPNWLPLVTATSVRSWAAALHATWGSLCRCASPAVALNPSFHSLLPVPGPFIIPGARFREGYYWDSYWAIQGLLVCGLTQLARDIVLNLVYCVETHGFVPNGLRSYYLNRSQPPLLAAMVESVWQSTQDVEFLRKALPAIDKELEWWREHPRSLLIKSSSSSSSNENESEPEYLVSRYYATWTHPRPESLKEDVETASNASASSSVYRDIASAAESGWDFSSRWFGDGKTLATIQTAQVIPADLNALLYKAERTAATLAMAAAEIETERPETETKETQVALAVKWTTAAAERLEAINALLWDEHQGRWRDRCLNSNTSDTLLPPNNNNNNNKTTSSSSSSTSDAPVYASDFVPLWCGCAIANSPRALHVISSLHHSGLLAPGGVAASTVVDSGQQWDWPNAWPPLQHMLAEGCSLYGGEHGAQLAKVIAERYLRTAHAAWVSTGRMFEKFDVREVGVKGGGGEYACMDGFGWTNGVALVWLEKYGYSDDDGGGGDDQVDECLMSVD